MRKTIIIAVVLCAILGIFVSCSNNAAEKFGTLDINIETSVSRGLEPMPMETKAYNVTVTDAGGNVAFSSQSSTKTRYSALIPVGACHIYVEALNKNGDVIGTGSVSGEVEAGYTNTITVFIEELVGNGIFSIAIRGSEGHTMSYVIKNAALEVVCQGNLSYADGKYAASEQLPNGFYTFSIIWDETGEYVKTDTIRVIKDKTIVYSAEFFFLIDGTLTIANEIIETPVIVLNRSAKALTPNKTLTVSAEISGIENYSCFWAVDEQPLSEPATYADLELSMADYSEGEHTVALFVTNGTIIWSESTKFAVLSERPTELEVSGIIEVWILGDVLIPSDMSISARFGSRFTRSFSAVGHRFESLGSESVILSCSLNYSDYTYYLDSAYDSVNDRTVVYIIIDQYIEDPAYLEVSLEAETWYSNNNSGAFGIYLNATNHFITMSEESDYWKRNGVIPFISNSETKIVKVPADTYTFNDNTWNNIANYFYVVPDKTSVSIASGETKSMSFVEGEYAIVDVQIPDSYADGTQFYEWRYYGNCQINNGCITLKQRPNRNYSYTLVPQYDKDCYYTVNVNKPVGSHTVTAVRQESEFVETELSIPTGRCYFTVTGDCLIPEDMLLQCAIGESYTSIRTRIWRNSFNINVSEASTLKIWTTRPEEYSITASIERTEGSQTYVTLFITTKSDDYATLNVSYDFDFALNSSRSTAISLGINNSNEAMILPIVDKSITEIKVAPGYYYNWGWWNTLRDDLDNEVYPALSVEDFNVSAGDSFDVSIQMKPYVRN